MGYSLVGICALSVMRSEVADTFSHLALVISAFLPLYVLLSFRCFGAFHSGDASGDVILQFLFQFLPLSFWFSLWGLLGLLPVEWGEFGDWVAP